jgi:hypothetical protein
MKKLKKLLNKKVQPPTNIELSITFAVGLTITYFYFVS